MLFLIEYDRDKGKVVALVEFKDTERQRAEDARINLEVGLNKRGISREVVLLQASSKSALEQTHRRYFVGLDDLAKATNS